MTVVIITIAVLIILLIAIQKYKRRKKTLSNLTALFRLFKKTFEASTKEAKERFLLKEYNRAIAIADQILEAQPKNHEVLLLRALSLEAINYNLESIEDFELANSIKEIDANTTGLLGLTYKKIGNFEKSQDYLKQSIEKGSNTYEANYNANTKASPLAIELYILKTKIPENLRRRNKIDFIKYLTESDKVDFIEGIKKQIHNLEVSKTTYPKDDEYLRLYAYSKNILNKLEQNSQ